MIRAINAPRDCNVIEESGGAAVAVHGRNERAVLFWAC